MNPNSRVWDRIPERRRALSRFLSLVLENLRSANGGGLSRAQLETAIQRVLGATAATIRDGTPLVTPGGSHDDKGAVRVALPGRVNPPMHLEVRVDRSRGFDLWSRQVILDVAHIATLALAALPRSSATAADARAGAPLDSSTLVGSSPRMVRLRHEISRMASTDFTVLIEGESGSGKELVARRIHEESARRAGRFIGVNCAALVETLLEAELFGIEDRTATGVRGRRGKFELADRGTLFLDEVSDLSPSAQAKLLRAIQEMSVERVGGHSTRTVDIRIVVATNQSLLDLVSEGRFRADLYYRLSGVEIHVPPLRARRGDVTLLARHFLERHRAVRDIGLSDSAVDALLTYAWPGNVRELERVIERAVTLATSGQITLEDLPPKVTGKYTAILDPSLRRADTMRAWGSRYARIVLDRCDNNKRQACQALGISYHTLQAYLTYEPPERSRVQGVPIETGVAKTARDARLPTQPDASGINV